MSPKNNTTTWRPKQEVDTFVNPSDDKGENDDGDHVAKDVIDKRTEYGSSLGHRREAASSVAGEPLVLRRSRKQDREGLRIEKLLEIAFKRPKTVAFISLTFVLAPGGLYLTFSGNRERA
jgi:hypothetical protein